MPIKTDLKSMFEDVYYNEIDTKLDECERFRLNEQKKHSIYRKSITAILICFSACFLLFIYSFKNPLYFGLCFCVLAVAVPVLCCLYVFAVCKLNTIKKEYRDAIKKPLMEPFLSLFGDFKLTNKELIRLSEIRKSGFFTKAVYKKDDDNIEGIYNGIPVLFCETRLWHGSTSVTDFSGLIVKVKLKRKYSVSLAGVHKISTNALIKILHDASNTYYNLISPMFTCKLNNGDKNTEYLYTNSHDFDKTANNEIALDKIQLDKFSDWGFEFYSNNPDNLDNVFYKILNPTLAEKINNICISTISSGFRFIIKDEYIYMFISSQNLIRDNGLNDRNTSQSSNRPVQLIAGYNSFFEVGSMDYPLTNKKLNRELFYKLFNDLSSIFDFVDYLKECDLV